MEETKRVYAALVAAGLIMGPDSKLLLVEKRSRLTLPTGHMDSEKDRNLEDALVREMKEEIKDKAGRGIEVNVMGSLGTMVRNKDTVKSKLIEIFRCAINLSEICFEEKGETNFFWVDVDDALGIENLDDLAREAIQRLINYLKGHISFRIVNGGDYEEGRELEDEQELHQE